MMLPDNTNADFDHTVVVSIQKEEVAVARGILHPITFISGVYLFLPGVKKECFLQFFPNALHYLDVFWLIMPINFQWRKKLWNNLYKLISPCYERYTNHSQNLSCVKYFRKVIEAKKLFSPNMRILDFGCGYGISSEVFSMNSIIGYDNNECMCEIARERGMVVIDSSEFNTLKPDSFDGCIASYVFHMDIDYKSLIQISNVIKTEGFVIANFYKEVGKTEVVRFFQDLDFEINNETDSERMFGSVICFRKR